MTSTPHMTDDLRKLSETAQIVLGSTFGWNATVTYHMIESVPSPEMQAALDELVGVGALIREMGMDDMPAHGKAVRYRVPKGFDLKPHRQIAADRIFAGTAPSIRVFVPISEAALRQGGEQ